ncbi:MAG: ATP-dependent helicase, partial [Leptolyngbya foveolarum]
MATLHGNWLPDIQRFFLWGETWRKAKAVSFPTLLAENPSDLSKLVAPQPYQLNQKELAEIFIKGEEIDLSWMQAIIVPKVAKTPKKPSGKEPNGKTSTRRSKQPSVWQSRVVVLPTKFDADGLLPSLSADAEVADELCPWQVSGAVLDAAIAPKFLSALPLGQSEASAFVGDDLRYWSHLTRWCLDLLARGKFVPVVSADRKGTIASCQLLLDSAVDQTRLRDF